jgi:UPF0716 protein FxsA
MWLFLIFVAVPIIEIALFIQVGGAIGLLPTLLIVVLTALAGTALMRHQGMQALAGLQNQLASGGDPTGPIAHGAMILIAGMLLLTPGFFTDSLGLLLLVPAVRDRVISWAATRVAVQSFSFGRSTQARPRPEPRASRDTIDAEYEILNDPPGNAPRGTSKWTRPEK